MLTKAPGRKARPERISDRAAYVPDEEAVARWAAWYEGLPEELRDALDDLGRGMAPER